MSHECVPLRYDLIDDLGRCLFQKGLVTRQQYEEAAAEQYRSFEQGQYIAIGEVLIRQGVVSRDQLAHVRRSLTLFDLPADDSGPDPMFMPPASKLLMLMLRIVVNSSATALRFLPSAKAFQVSYRVDGVWYDMESPPLHLLEPLVDVIRRISTDGRMLVRADDKSANVTIGPLISVEDKGLMMKIEYPAA